MGVHKDRGKGASPQKRNRGSQRKATALVMTKSSDFHEQEI